MTVDPRSVALRVAVLKVLADRVNTAQRQARTEVAELMDTGDRLNPAAGGVRLAAVTKAHGRTTASVTDPNAFARWCAEHYPHNVEHKPVVRVAWTNAVLDASKEAGEPCTPDGTTGVPGIAVGEGEPTITVRLTPDAAEAVERLWRAGQIDIEGTVRELPRAGVA